MLRISLLFLFCVCLVGCKTTSHTSSLQEISELYAGPSLPNAVLAYNYLVRLFGGSGAAIVPSTIRSPVLHRIEDAFDRARIDFRFHDRVFVVPMELTGSVVGISNATVSSSHTDLLFVTTPLEELKGGILIVSSRMSPQRTYIIGLDTQCVSTVFYDSFYPPNEETSIDSVYDVTVLSPAKIRMRERWPYQGQMPDDPTRRVLEVTIANGGCTFVCREE